MKLSDHLLSLDQESFKKATQHKFLHEVGTLQVEPKHLKSWLIQDRYYTGGYFKMMGLMIARLPLYEEQRELGDNNTSYSEGKAHRVVKLLSFALSNVYRENQFFTDILSRKPYEEERQSTAQKLWTSKYIDYVRKVTQESGYDLGEAIVVLWAMEIVFFTAWNHAKAIHSQVNKNLESTIHIQTCEELMTNWTMEEFEEFVNECEFLVNQLDTSDPRRLQSFERVFKEILALEVEFWDMAYTA
jgi:thiaminase